MLDLLLSGFNDYALAFDLNKQEYLLISAGIEQITGYTQQEFLKNPRLFNEIIDQKDRTKIQAHLAALIENEWSELSYRITDAHNNIQWINEKRGIFTDKKNGHKVLLSILKNNDILPATDNDAKDEVDNVLFNHNPNPMWIYEIPSLRILKVNEAAITSYGYSKQEFLKMAISDIRPRFNLAKFTDYLNGENCPNSQEFAKAGVWKHENKKGEPIYAEISGCKIKYANYDSRIIVATDVTEKIRSQEAVKIREQFLNSLIDSQTNFLVRINTEGLYTFVNKQFLKMLGAAKNEIVGHHFFITTIPQERELCENAFKNALITPGKVIHHRHKKLDKAGNLHDTEWEFIAITDEDGNVSEIQGVGRDITQEEEIKKQIKLADQKLDSFIENITDAFFIIDKEWKFIRVNDTFEKMSQKGRDELLGNVLWDVFPETVGTGFEKAYKEAIHEQRSTQFIEHFAHINMWFKATVYPSAEGLAVFIKDITHEKIAQQEVILTKNNLEGLINNTDDLIWSIDREGRYEYINNAYKDIILAHTGVVPKAGDSPYYTDTYTEEVIDEWRGYYNRAFNGEKYFIREKSIDPATKQVLHFETSFNPIFNEKGEVTIVGCFSRNITGRLKTANALIDQNNRLRNIAILSSHDLRRPVASMLGLINMIDRENFSNPENKEIIEHILTTTKEIDDVIHLIVDKTFTDDLTIKAPDKITDL